MSQRDPDFYERGDYELPVHPLQLLGDRIAHEIAPGHPAPALSFDHPELEAFRGFDEYRDRLNDEISRVVLGDPARLTADDFEDVP